MISCSKPYGFANLLFRRQFIAGPRFIDTFGSWKKIRIRNKKNADFY